MRGVFLLVLLCGMGLAGFAVYMVNQSFEQNAAQLAAEQRRANAVVQTIEIYSPSRNMTYGELLRAEDVTLIRYASGNLPEGVFRTEEDLFPEGLEVPRVVRIPMRVNEPITSFKVTEAGAPRGVTALLDPGMRAFPLPNTLVGAFVGELRRSDRIDLYWVGRINGQNSSRLVKSGLEIISIEEPDENGNGGGRNVVLQVSQGDFADLRVLQSAGTLSLTPVAQVDEVGGDTSIQTNIQDALGIEAPVVEEAPAPVAGPEMCTRTERRGVNVVRITEPCE